MEVTMPAPFDDHERMAIRERLVLSAIDALGRGGLGAASVSELARQAGIAKGSFYAFYPSKEYLFMEALERMEDRYRSLFMAAVDFPGTPVEKLAGMLLSALEMVESEPALRFIDGSAAERLSRALPPERIAEHAAADARAAEALLASWKDKGLVRADLGTEDLAGAMYVVFLVGSGLRGLPPSLCDATRRVCAEGLAARLTKDSSLTGTPGAGTAGVGATGSGITGVQSSAAGKKKSRS
ncbi:MAG: TetR/AcrR family transcriptional regulator [Clostridia bacterium]